MFHMFLFHVSFTLKGHDQPMLLENSRDLEEWAGKIEIWHHGQLIILYDEAFE